MKRDKGKKKEEYYFPRDRIYDTSKFSKLDLEKWWRDKALLDMRHIEYRMDKIPYGEEWEELRKARTRLMRRIEKLENFLDEG